MDAAPFAGLIEDQRTLVKVQLAIENAVLTSFGQDQNRVTVPRKLRMTQAEVKRRTNICIRIFRVLRGDMSWSWMRCVDYLSRFLRMELDGQSWEPDGHAMWAPEAKIE